VTKGCRSAFAVQAKLKQIGCADMETKLKVVLLGEILSIWFLIRREKMKIVEILIWEKANITIITHKI